MARIDVLKEEIAEARAKRLSVNIGIGLGTLLFFLMFFVVSIPKEVKIWVPLIFGAVLMYGCGYGIYIDRRIKKLKKELEAIK